MKLADLPIDPLIVELKPVDLETFEGSFHAQESIHLKSQSNDQWIMRANTETCIVRVCDLVQQQELQWLNDGVGHVEAWIEKVSHNKQDVTGLLVAVYRFHTLYSLNDRVSIQVAEDILEGIIQENNPKIENYEQAVDHLMKECLIDGPNNNQRLVIRFVEHQFDRLESFRIYGKRNAFDVSRRESGYRITRHVRNARRQIRQSNLIILEGDMRFIDATVEAQQKQRFKTELDMIVVESNGSYLNIWDEYNQLERKKVLAKATRWGWIKFSGQRELPDGRLRLNFHDPDKVSSFMQRIERANELDLVISEELPPHLSNDFVHDTNIAEVRQYPVEVDSIHDQAVVVRLRNERSYPKQSGFLFASIHGDTVRLDRRQKAWNIVRDLDTPIPGLGLLLERSKVYTPRTYKKLKLKSSVLRSYFDVRPNSNQSQALELTLQTPDILLIQGPPGTGKTQVISALSRLIADEKLQEKHDLGKVLLTSYQHAAVDNVAERTTVMDLPTPKIGGKRNETNSNTARILQEWKSAIQERVDRAHNLSLRPTVSTVKQYIQDQLLGYQRKPGSHAETIHMLQSISNRCLGHITPERQSEFDTFVETFAMHTSFGNLTAVEQRGIERAVRSLRTNPIAFMDDGPSKARKLLVRLEQAIDRYGVHLLPSDEIYLLQQAADWEDNETPSFLGQLQQIAEKLLLNLGADPDAGRLNVDVNNILSQLLEDLYCVVKHHPGHVEAVAQNFLDDLENDPNAVEAAIEHYTSVLAATCQQSGGCNFHTRKTTEGWSFFDTVIVDEASRANPLDLLIPIVQAKRRIILVGDHRQLPQLLEPDVESDLSSSASETRDLLQKSLFERLFTYMDELSKKDGVTRRITLNTQYRMHPRLAQFVSDTFYAPYGEAFGSVLPVEYFSHDIADYEGRIAVWIDVPLGDNTREHSSGGNKCRPAEAKRIAREAKQILDGAKAGISIGIITFYSAQVTEINRELQKNGILEDGEHGLEIASEYASVSLQVDTVDAFQGKEFDVVLLSLVRSNEKNNFGFLTLENRLCVALSRQKKLLIAVGDAAMYSSEAASQKVAGLTQFYKLCCEEPYGRLI